MIFSETIGTSGKGVERYLIYLPLIFAPGRELSGIDFEKVLVLDHLELKFIKNTHFVAISLGYFDTEKDAIEYLPKLKSAVMWVSLKYSIGIGIPDQLSPVKMFKKPISIPEKGISKELTKNVGWEAIDGTYDSDKLLVLPNHSRLTRFEMGKVSVIAGLGVDNFVSTLEEVISLSSPEKVINDQKILLAINIYSSYFFEQSPEAKFIKLVTILEALTPDSVVDERTLIVLKDLKEKVKSERKKYTKDSTEWQEINGLLSRVGQLKRNSIGTSLKMFIENMIKQEPAIGKSQEIISQIKDIYNRRSKLLHEGEMNSELLMQDLNFLRDFVPTLLKTIYKAEASG